MGMPIRIRVSRMDYDDAFFSAPPSDWMKALLVSVAPEIMSTLALWALIASSRSMGSACLLMLMEVRRSDGYFSTFSAVSRPP